MQNVLQVCPMAVPQHDPEPVWVVFLLEVIFA